MQVTLQKLQPRTPDFQLCKRLYHTAFPADERAPFWLMQRRMKHPDVDFWGIYADGICAGLMYVVSYGTLSYLFYFAISDACRGKGIGSRALAALRETYPDHRIFLAIERLEETAPNYPERVRRKAFYERNGFEDLHLFLQEGPVIYALLGCGGTVTPEEYDALITVFTGKLLKRFVKMRIL